MLTSRTILSQNSFGLTGLHPVKSNSLFNSFENNPSNYSMLKDWGLSFSYGGEFSSNINANLYLLSLSKRIGGNFFSLRYTPGYQKDFIFKTGELIVNEDSSLQSLESQYSYKEIFGLGYSYKLNKEFSAGFTLRYFNQEFKTGEINAVFLDTSLYLTSQTSTQNYNFWMADLGIDYLLNDNFSFSLSSINLLTVGEGFISEENKNFELKKTRKAMLGFSFTPEKYFNFSLLYETDNSFQAGINSSFNIFNENISVGISAIHDKYQAPFIAGIIPSIGYSSKYFDVSISGVKYFSDRTTHHSISELEQDGFSNIINNKYSFDKVILSVSLTLNTITEKTVEFLEVKILKEIYPTLSDNYIDFPFASAKIVNLTENILMVKPESRIEGITNDRIQSPKVSVSPFDTADVFFYTIIPENYSSQKTEISYAEFFITGLNEDPDDQYQNPVLVNGVNAWDGKVINLKRFIKKDFDFSIGYSKNILSSQKSLLDTLPGEITPFYKSKIIFENLVNELSYIADPRASAEHVQFPHETIALKGGDCDDLSVCFSSLLESSGIETALVDYKKSNDVRHVNLLINTELSPSRARVITQNDSKYFTRKNEKGINEVWIAVEVTSLTNFEEAWGLGAEKFNEEALKNYGLAKGNVEIIDVN